MMNNQPGSYSFNAKLLGRLNADLTKNQTEMFYIEHIEHFSRNTLIYRIRSGNQRLVCKAQMTKPIELLAAEYRVLIELEHRLTSNGVRSLIPVAMYPDLGVLVTREETGQILRTIIDLGLRSHYGSEVQRYAKLLMQQAAFALHTFHAKFGIEKSPKGNEIVSQYLDYSPRNILIAGDTRHIETILVDPPEYEQRGTVYLDLGTFCFDLARASFTPNVFSISSLAWLDQLKWEFLKSYFLYLGRPLRLIDLTSVRNWEESRANRVLYWYSRFFRYKTWPKELARFLYFSPVVIWYKYMYLNRSYSWLSRQLARL